MTDLSTPFYVKTHFQNSTFFYSGSVDSTVHYWSSWSRLHSPLQMTFTVKHQCTTSYLINHAEMFEDNTETIGRGEMTTAIHQNMAFFNWMVK